MEKNTKERQAERNPLLFKLAIPFALSLAGILFSTLTNLRTGKKSRLEQHEMDYAESVSQCEFEDEISDDDDDVEVEEEDEEEEEEDDDEEEEKPKTSIHPLESATEISIQQFHEDQSNMCHLLESAKEISIQQCHEDQSNIGEQIEGVRCLVASLEDKQSVLEAQFYEYCNMKEQESAFQKLQIMCLGLKLESLESQNERLEGTIAQFTGAMEQVDLVRAEIKLLQRMGKKLTRANRECSQLIRQYALKLQAKEEISRSNEEFHRTTKEIKEVADQLQKEIKAIEDKLEIGTPKKQVEEGLVEDRTRLDNTKLFEQLQHIRDQWSADTEEQIYLGWINACLRRELLIIQDEDNDGHDIDGELKQVPDLRDEVVMELPYDEHVENCSVEFCDMKHPSTVSETGDACASIVAKSPGRSLKKPRLLHKLKGWATGKGSCKKACGKGKRLE